MKLPTRLASAAATGSTFFLNFWPWLLGAFLLGAGSGALPAYKITRAFYRSETIEAKAKLAQFRADLAESKTAVLTDQARLQGEATKLVLDAVKRGTEKLSGQLAATSDAATLATLNQNVLSLQKDIRYACRNLPLPADYLDGLRIPRREARSAASDGNQP
jgi:hypothetical protein